MENRPANRLNVILAERRQTNKWLAAQPGLYESAYQAGIHSRYRSDRHISEETFKQLYRNWIDNSVNKGFEINDEEFVCHVWNKQTLPV